MGVQHAGDAGNKTLGELGQPDERTGFQGQAHQRFGPAAVLLGKVEIARHLQCHRRLPGKDGSFGGQVVAEEGWIGAVHENRRPDRFSGND